MVDDVYIENIITDTKKKGGGLMQINSIDNLMKNDIPFYENITSIYLKLDIEGAEYKALKGAEKTINKFRPLIAVAIYHNIDDMVRIPIYLSKLNNNYTFLVSLYTFL
jgi:hypothetical protein